MKRIALTCLMVCFLPIPASGQTGGGEEVEINLDSLSDGADSKKTGEADDPVLPLVIPTEIDKDARLMLAVLGILIPTATLLFPTRRKKPKQNKASLEMRVPENKER